ncbi:histidine kinase [Actinomadura luteofluorescens]|uniref:HAMP domain-containing sensor histidine kinase n=1 Tax=Actinomadura luteofluorescens TaxID=46163 RepID=UPI002164D651|nr:sensor histidine kinase [Actinomadura glauciflava]MCR3744418.1 two-component system, NarL family, sensor histidine kinase UhpB [Actinomadura glauciflava]
MRRTPASALFWRILGINGLIFVAGTLVLAVGPVTVSTPILLGEFFVLLGGLTVMVAANALLLRASLAPLEGLTALMARMDSLRSGDRLPAGGNGDLFHVVEQFNAMLDRLEADRSSSTALVLDAQEAERRRIAQELHDEIGQTLTVVLLELKPVVDRAPEGVAEELRDVQETVRSSLDEVRRVARRLRPGVLDDLGLTSALTALATDFSGTGGPRVTRRVQPGLEGLGADAELVIYRIAQESLTNVWRHSGARNAELSLTRDGEGRVVLRVADDGSGPPDRVGSGIHGMRERAMLIGAQLTIGPADGGGTEVRLVVPPPGARRA